MSTKESINISLKLIGKLGFSGISIKAPNATQALEKILKKTPEDVDPKRITAELKRQGLVEFDDDDEGTQQLTITPAGALRLQKIYMDELVISTPKKWDGRWRMVSFDIPVSQSKSRVYFTGQLAQLGLKMLQKSMWVHPYDCFEQVEHIASFYNVRRYCSFFEITSPDDQSLAILNKKFKNIIQK